MITKLKLWLAKRQMYKHTYRELSSLNNHELRDLGLDRSMLHNVAFEAAYGKETRYV